MIALPPRWTVVHELDAIALVHPGGAAVATVEYRECLRPLARAGDAVRRALAEIPSFGSYELPDCVERLTTFEGEFAAFATLEGVIDGKPAQVDLGFVFADDYYARISALCCRRDQFEAVTTLARQLVITDSHALGIRRRRFEYTPPRGWQAIVRRYVTDWIPREYPHDAIHVTVYPANPRRFSVREITSVLVGAVQIEHQDSRRIQTAGGLAGELVVTAYTASEGRRWKVTAVLEDERYVYPLEVVAESERHLADHRDELDAMISSIQVLPHERALRDDDRSSVQAHWAE